MIELETPHGPARAHVNEAEEPVATLVLGHGAGGGVGAPDLKAATEAALAVNVTTILVEQPYRVAGRKSAAPAAQLDTAWIAVVEQLPIEGPAALRRRALLRRARGVPHERGASTPPACSASRSRCTRPGGRRRRGCPSSSR